MTKMNFNRRDFLKTSAGVGLSTAFTSSLWSCSKSEEQKKKVEIPTWGKKASNGKALKAGLIGCGGRGTGAAVDFIHSGDDLSIVALADIFEDKLKACRACLDKQGNKVADDACFVGFDAYEKILKLNVDVVLICTPPVFHPLHFTEAVKANKHIYFEKPCAIDGPGLRKIIVANEQAKAKKLCVMSGFVRRSQKNVLHTWKKVAEGAIGEIVSADVVRNGGSMWCKERQSGQTDMEYLLRNWTNFRRMSGDQIVEQFIHELDQMQWFMNSLPTQAVGYGARERRKSGDQYDIFSVSYRFKGGLHSHAGTRLINGCDNDKHILVYGTKGYTNCTDKIFNLDGTIAWEYPYPKKEEKDSPFSVGNPYHNSHVRLVNAIRKKHYLNDTDMQVDVALTAIMGREAAYTGKTIEREKMMASKDTWQPEKWAMTDIPDFNFEVPIPGKG